MDEDCRDPPETCDDEREHFDVICRVNTEEGEAATTECRDDDGYEEVNGGRVIIDGGDVFVDPLANECFVDVTETRDLPPPEPKQQNASSIDIPDGNPWPSPSTHIGGTFGSFLYRTEASNNIPLSPMDQQIRDQHRTNADDDDDDEEENDEHYQSFGKTSSAGMDSYSYTYSDSSVSEKDDAHAHADHVAQRRMDIAGEVIRTLSTADDGADVSTSQLKLIAVLGILSSMSEDGALKEEKEGDEFQIGDQASDANSAIIGAEGSAAAPAAAAKIINGFDSYSTQVEKAIASRTTITADKEAATTPPMPTASNQEEASKQTFVESQLRELRGLAPNIDYASMVAGWDESVRSQLKDVTEKVSPVLSNFMESKEVKGSIDKFAHDITTVLETLDISINIENLTKQGDNDEASSATASSSRRTKPAPLQTKNTMNEEESVSGSTNTSQQQAGLRPFIRTKSLSPISGGGKDSNENDDDNAYVSSSARSTNNNSFFGGSDDQDGSGRMQKKGPIKNANTVEDVPCLKPSRFKGGGVLLPL